MIDALSTDCLQRESELTFFDIFNHHIDLIKNAKGIGKKLTGTSVEFVTQNIQQELGQEGIREDYRTKLEQMLKDVQNLI